MIYECILPRIDLQWDHINNTNTQAKLNFRKAYKMSIPCAYTTQHMKEVREVSYFLQGDREEPYLQ